MTTATEPRVPWAPLEHRLLMDEQRICRRDYRSLGDRRRGHTSAGGVDLNAYLDTLSTQELAERFDVATKTLYRWMAGGIPLWRADALACSMGYHPVDIWPEWYDVECP